jgi:UDP-N-acetylglucosamine--N-acetylmuramyl-(pentapeptide) pyrophosphoryl-undecaprenol N-acetylglucosamine transferase
MGAALAAADLVLSRAGASALGEYPLLGLPAILVPYPYAWRYQQVNARYLEERGGALLVKEADLAEHLFPLVHQLMGDASRRKAMSQAMKSLARPEAARAIAGLLKSLGTAAGKGRR